MEIINVRVLSHENLIELEEKYEHDQLIFPILTRALDRIDDIYNDPEIDDNLYEYHLNEICKKFTLAYYSKCN